MISCIMIIISYVILYDMTTLDIITRNNELGIAKRVETGTALLTAPRAWTNLQDEGRVGDGRFPLSYELIEGGIQEH
jgi:hypothetical protein